MSDKSASSSALTKEAATRAKEEELLEYIFRSYNIKYDKDLADRILKERPFLVVYIDEPTLHIAKTVKEVRRLCNGRSHINTYVISSDLYSADMTIYHSHCCSR